MISNNSNALGHFTCGGKFPGFPWDAAPHAWSTWAHTTTQYSPGARLLREEREILSDKSGGRSISCPPFCLPSTDPFPTFPFIHLASRLAGNGGGGRLDGSSPVDAEMMVIFINLGIFVVRETSEYCTSHVFVMYLIFTFEFWHSLWIYTLQNLCR